MKAVFNFAMALDGGVATFWVKKRNRLDVNVDGTTIMSRGARSPLQKGELSAVLGPGHV